MNELLDLYGVVIESLLYSIGSPWFYLIALIGLAIAFAVFYKLISSPKGKR